MPTPSPAGTYTGSCNYNLNNGIDPNNAGALTGEVDVTNTGNIGTVDKVRIARPQEDTTR